MSEGVHIRHCCAEHGCKYGDEDCPVSEGTVKQENPCEYCYEEIRGMFSEEIVYKYNEFLLKISEYLIREELISSSDRIDSIKKVDDRFVIWVQNSGSFLPEIFLNIEEFDKFWRKDYLDAKRNNKN